MIVGSRSLSNRRMCQTRLKRWYRLQPELCSVILAPIMRQNRYYQRKIYASFVTISLTFIFHGKWHSCGHRHWNTPFCGIVRCNVYMRCKNNTFVKYISMIHWNPYLICLMQFLTNHRQVIRLVSLHMCPSRPCSARFLLNTNNVNTVNMTNVSKQPSLLATTGLFPEERLRWMVGIAGQPKTSCKTQGCHLSQIGDHKNEC